MAALTFDVSKDIAPSVLMTVKVIGITKWRIRMWIAAMLIKLAGKVMNVGIALEIE